jgi:nicotinate-nucleotide adenylyltransferase
VTAIPRLPLFAPGMRIGLLGGSFNPPHEGHAHITRVALRRLQLDRVWWLVTPGNPLKSLDELAALQKRVEAARRLDAGPRVIVTDIEAQIGSRYTYETLAWIKRRAPSVHFVWIMGADNLRQFDRWRHWRLIADLVPIVVVDRPGSTLRAICSRGGAALARWRVPERDAARFAVMSPPALLFLHGRRSGLSSTELRRTGNGDQGHDARPAAWEAQTRGERSATTSRTDRTDPEPPFEVGL